MTKDFVTVTPDSGTGNATINITVSKNEQPVIRKTELEVSTGKVSKVLSISQAPGNLIMGLLPNMYLFMDTYEGDSAWRMKNEMGEHTVYSGLIKSNYKIPVYFADRIEGNTKYKIPIFGGITTSLKDELIKVANDYLEGEGTDERAYMKVVFYDEYADNHPMPKNILTVSDDSGAVIPSGMSEIFGTISGSSFPEHIHDITYIEIGIGSDFDDEAYIPLAQIQVQKIPE